MIFDPQFKGVLEVGHTVILKGSAFEKGESFRCIAVGALPEYIKDFGALTAATWSSDNEDTNLELETNELGQLRMQVLDDIIVRLKNPAPVSQWRTAKTRFYLPKFPTDAAEDWEKELLFRMSEFFYFHNTTPRFDLYSTNTATMSRILFRGWRYKLEPLPEDKTGMFTLVVNGWPSVK